MASLHTTPRPRSYLVIVGLLWLAIAAVLLAFRQVLLPFGVALLVAYVIEPLVTRIAGWEIRGVRLPRWVAILLLYAVFFAALYLFSVAALPQIYREMVRLTAEARHFLNGLTPDRIAWYIRVAEEWLTSHGVPIALGDPVVGAGDLIPVQPDAAALAVGADQAPEGAKLRLDLEEAVRTTAANASVWLRTHFLDLVGYSQRVVAGLFGGVFMLFFVLMVTAFLLIDTNGILRFFRGMVPPEYHHDWQELLSRIDRKLAGVVRGQIVICLVNGALTLVGLLLLQVKFAFVLATVATVLSFIPIFGTVLSTIPIVAVGLTQSFSTGFAALAWILGIHALEAYLLNPKIMGSAARIHPALIAFALLAGERTFGFVGALFAVPVASILLATFAHFKARADRMQAAADGLPPPLDEDAPVELSAGPGAGPT